MSSTHVCVRLARRYTARATRDEAYARSLLDGHADDASMDAPLELLELSRAVGRTVELLERQAPALADVMHVALLGYARQTTPTETYEVTWLHHGLDTAYGWPAVIAEPGVVRLADQLEAVAAALADHAAIAEVVSMAAFYRAAAVAGQVMIVGEV